MRNVGLDEAQAGIKVAGRNINNLDVLPLALYKWMNLEVTVRKSKRVPEKHLFLLY